MAVLRFLAVTLIALLLLSPFLQTFDQTVQDPVVVVAQDNSSSIRDAFTEEDSAAYQEEVRAFIEELDDKFTVEPLLYGSDITRGEEADFVESSTDIATMIDYVHRSYGDQNLAAIIVTSDGLYNQGKNPLYQSQKVNSPVYAIALGDTTPSVDLAIQQVLHNRISFLGDRFPIQVDIQANRLEGRRATVSIQRITGGNVQTLAQEALTIDRDNFFQTKEFVLDADQAGVNRYRVRVTGISGEEQYNNNIKDFYIEVIDGRLEVLVLGSAPHPDMAALKELISINQNYNVTVELAENFTEAIEDFDLVIFHQLPDGRTNIDPWLKAMESASIPSLFVLGEATSLTQFNTAQELLEITGGNSSPNEVQPLINGQFELFKIPDGLEQQLRSFAPLYAPFGEYATSAAASVYLYQKIGNVDTRYPLMLFGESKGIKTGIIAGEGIWKWRLVDFLQNGSHELTAELVNKAVQFVTVKDDKRKFRAEPSKSLYSDEETITFTAELYNQAYELINEPDAFLVIRDEADKEYSYTFSKTSDSYVIDVGRFAVGEYRYTAFTDYGGQRQSVNGKFNVQEIQLENYVTTADHSLLFALADKYGGDVYYPGSMASLAETLNSDESLKPVIYQSVGSQPLLNFKWVFFMLLLLLSAEWFMRRFFGGY